MKKLFIFIFIFCTICVFGQNDSVSFYLKSGATKYEAKNYSSAIKDFSAALRINPKNAEAFKLRGISNYLVKNYKDAHTDLNQGLELNPDCSDCIFYLSKVHEMLGETSESEKNIDDLSKSMSHNDALQHVAKGNKYLNANNYSEAEKEYDKALAIEEIAEAYYQKGYIQIVGSQNAEAIVLFDKALKIDSTYYLAWAMKGSANFLLNNFEEAIKNFTTSIKFSPTYAYAYISRGNAYYNLSKTLEACADWKKAKELGSSEAETQLSSLCK